MKNFVTILIFFLFAAESYAQMRSSETGCNYVIDESHFFKFKFNDIETTVVVNIGDYNSKLNYYHTLNHAHGNYRGFIRNEPFKQILNELSTAIYSTCIANNYDLIDYTLAFVQSIPHFAEMGAYQQYPSELVINGTGDCSDKSVLFAAVLDSYGGVYKNIFIQYPGHVNVGLWSTRDGCYIKFQDKKFIICETNSFSKIGEFWNCGISYQYIEE